MQKWSKELVIREILERKSHGEKLNSDHAQKNLHRLYLAACVYFGGWRQAIEAAGIPYAEVRIKEPNRKKVWSKEIIIETILRMHAAGENLNSNFIQTKRMKLYGASIKYFGGWKQAVEAAGLDYEKIRKKKLRTWSKKALAEEILRRYRLGLSIRGGDVAKLYGGVYQAAMRHFGKNGWARARKFAGLPRQDPDPRLIWTKRSVVAEIRRLFKEGVRLNTGNLQTKYGYILAAGRKVFETWEKAIRAARLDYSAIQKMKSPGWWNKIRVIQAIQKLVAAGVRLSSKSVHLSHGDVFSAAVVRFGSWSQAVEAAGIDYSKHSLLWSTKATIRKMSDSDYEELLKR